MILDHKVKIEFNKPEVDSLNVVLKALGITGKLDAVLKKSYLVLEGDNRNSRKLLKVFHPSLYMVLALSPGKESASLQLSSSDNCWLSVTLKGLKELVKNRPGELNDHFSVGVLDTAVEQHKMVTKYYKKGRSVRIRFLIQKKLPFLKSLYPPGKLVKASKMLENSLVSKEMGEKLPLYLESGSLKRILVQSSQIKLTD